MRQFSLIAERRTFGSSSQINGPDPRSEEWDKHGAREIALADLPAYHTEPTGTPAPPTSDGRMYCHETPGFGVEPDFENLGNPVPAYQ